MCDVGKCTEETVEIVYAGLRVCKRHWQQHTKDEINLVQIGIDEGTARATDKGWEKVKP